MKRLTTALLVFFLLCPVVAHASSDPEASTLTDEQRYVYFVAARMKDVSVSFEATQQTLKGVSDGTATVDDALCQWQLQLDSLAKDAAWVKAYPAPDRCGNIKQTLLEIYNYGHLEKVRLREACVMAWCGQDTTYALHWRRLVLGHMSDAIVKLQMEADTFFPTTK